MQHNRNSEIDLHQYASWVLTKVQKQFNGRNLAFLTNGDEAIGHPQTEKKSWTQISHYTQKLTQIYHGLKCKHTIIKLLL